MIGRKLGAAGVVLGVGGTLFFLFQGLGHQLPQLFPHLAKETRVAPPPIVADTADDPLPAGEEPESELQPPAAAIALKRSGESLPDLQPRASDPASDLVTDRKLVSPSLLPDSISGGRSISGNFEIPPKLVPIVDFWKKVYGVYSSDQVVIHDMDHLEIEYGVLDFSDLDRRGFSDTEKKAAREASVRSATERIQAALSELDEWEGLRPLSEEAQRVSKLFQHVQGPDKYKKAKEALRTQTGMKNRFAEAVRRSGRYLPHFEQVFAYYGVPKEITRLAFVESMFRERALSKVAAAGLWQFMAETGRRYMTVDKNIDERYDPIVATHGAARLLLKNYELLGSWPLAINAYNSGPGNLQKASQKLGTNDIARIITEYRSGSYAFASRNFYPSFLAALHVYENHRKYLGNIAIESPWRFDTTKLPATMSFPEIAFLSDTPLDDLKDYNPAYGASVFEGKFSLPAGSQIRLPAGKQPTFAARFVQYSSNQVASLISPPTYHVVSPGESYTDIAARYGIPFQDLRRANADTPETQAPPAGKVLMIPNTSSLVQN